MADKKNIKNGSYIIGLIYLTHWLPRWLIKGVGVFFGHLGALLNNRNARVVKRNLELCFPHLDDLKRQKIANGLITHNALMTKEVANAWVGSRQSIANAVNQVKGDELIKNANQANQPLIIVVPHIGNWEYFWHWLQLNFDAISMYSPAHYQALDNMMLNARKRFGGRPFATDSKGIMGLLRALKKGGVMMILPDQVPKKEGGVFAPFFDMPAYTMTLVHKFVEKTGANLCFGACIRKDDGQFKITIEPASFETNDNNAEQFCALMNKQIEAMIVKYPEQYQWNYKRFKRNPDDINVYQ